MAAARILCGWVLVIGCSGCGMFGGTSQLKQLQAENDKLVTEYRAQRDKVAKLQETNVALEQRVAEAEKLLARSGHNLPSSRLSQVPNRGSTSPGTVPPYVPPTAINSGNDTANANASGSQASPDWRPTRRK